ncbi:unnamed protein product [Brassica rapa]|uniref:Uncharacterized protein n=1 Tax=Brassica campestris TaxID=3711 RepID=A0A8D9HGN0_BRACM|nr:unnamed protein product [Brassica rapa]
MSRTTRAKALAEYKRAMETISTKKVEYSHAAPDDDVLITKSSACTKRKASSNQDPLASERKKSKISSVNTIISQKTSEGQVKVLFNLNTKLFLLEK